MASTTAHAPATPHRRPLTHNAPSTRTVRPTPPTRVTPGETECFATECTLVSLARASADPRPLTAPHQVDGAPSTDRLARQAMDPTATNRPVVNRRGRLPSSSRSNNRLGRDPRQPGGPHRRSTRKPSRKMPRAAAASTKTHQVSRMCGHGRRPSSTATAGSSIACLGAPADAGREGESHPDTKRFCMCLVTLSRVQPGNVSGTSQEARSVLTGRTHGTTVRPVNHTGTPPSDRVEVGGGDAVGVTTPGPQARRSWWLTEQHALLWWATATGGPNTSGC